MVNSTKKVNKILSIDEAAAYMHVTRQAVYVAIRRGLLQATKKDKLWFISTDDLDSYRINKYNPDTRKRNGVLIFDMDKGEYSVPQVCKVISAALGKPYPPQRVYYLIRMGDLLAHRKGAAWVILKEHAEGLLKAEQNSNESVKFSKRFA